MNYLIDSCILIDHLRGNRNIDFLKLNRRNHLKVSIITTMELILGARNKKEIANMKNAFAKIEVVHIDEKISELAYDFICQYNKSHNLFINDAIIAATAITKNTTLVTLNISDFKFIPGISIYKL
ncbi:MAG: type II toxin-antitoxin system VapC family toxin [Treponemataceae bacterium]|nr:MAG: type II toxin-antitoxin system VapC family toxin [Treponemataceae bacterium]